MNKYSKNVLLMHWIHRRCLLLW